MSFLNLPTLCNIWNFFSSLKSSIKSKNSFKISKVDLSILISLKRKRYRRIPKCSLCLKSNYKIWIFFSIFSQNIKDKSMFWMILQVKVNKLISILIEVKLDNMLMWYILIFWIKFLDSCRNIKGYFFRQVLNRDLNFKIFLMWKF